MEMVWTGHFRSPSPRRSEDTSIKDKAKLALNAILQNIQAPGAVKVMPSLEVKDLQIYNLYISMSLCFLVISCFLMNFDGKHLVGPFSFCFITMKKQLLMSIRWTFASPPTDKSISLGLFLRVNIQLCQLFWCQNQAFARVLTHSHIPKEYLTFVEKVEASTTWRVVLSVGNLLGFPERMVGQQDTGFNDKW